MPRTLLTTFTLTAFLLAGCSANVDNTEAQTTATAASASPTQNTGTESSPTAAKPHPTYGPHHQELELTDEELAAYQAGELVEANDKHPALNVPEPLMPEIAKERSWEGAKAFVEYWVETKNYAIYTLNTSPERSAISKEWTSEQELLDTLSSLRIENKWFSGAETSIEIENQGFIAESENYVDILVTLKRTDGKLHSLENATSEDEPGFNKQGSPLTLTLSWEENQWKVINISGIQGVGYEES